MYTDEGRILRGDHVGPLNITGATRGFLPLSYRLLDCRFKDYELFLEAFHFHFQFLAPSTGYQVQHQNLNRPSIACLWLKSPTHEHRGALL